MPVVLDGRRVSLHWLDVLVSYRGDPVGLHRVGNETTPEPIGEELDEHNKRVAAGYKGPSALLRQSLENSLL